MILLFGIPNCDTVRKAQKWLKENKHDFQFQDFKKTPLTSEQIMRWLELVSLSDLLNPRSTGWKKMTEAQKVDLLQNHNLTVLIDHPTLIKRPVLQYNNQIHFGFKDTDYQAFFEMPHGNR